MCTVGHTGIYGCGVLRTCSREIDAEHEESAIFWIYINEYICLYFQWQYFFMEEIIDLEPYLKILKRSKQLEETITNFMLKIGFTANLKGYDYLRDALILVIKEPTLKNKITKYLYPTIALKYNVKTNSVERCIRQSIAKLWLNGDIKMIDSIFKNTVSMNKEKPTNSEFMFMIADHFRVKLKIG